MNISIGFAMFLAIDFSLMCALGSSWQIEADSDQIMTLLKNNQDKVMHKITTMNKISKSNVNIICVILLC